MEDEVTNVDLVLVLDHQRAGDLAPIHIGPIGTLEINDDELAVFDNDPRVALGDVTLGQDDVVALDASYIHLGLVELEATLLSTFFRDDNRKHSASGDIACMRGAKLAPCDQSNNFQPTSAL